MSSLVHFIPQLLPADECAELIELSERFGFLQQRFGAATPPEIRHRVAIDDASIARDLWNRLQPHLRPLAEYYDDQLLADAGLAIGDFAPAGLNERLRFYKYHQDERFSRHFDIPFKKSPTERSLLSVILYLNDDFDGGQTTFDKWTIAPQTGSAIVFAHELMHEGQPITAGVKRVLRTDVMGQLTEPS